MDSPTFMAIWRYFFNCYRHHSSLVLRNGDGTYNILHSREDVTQGYPLAMVVYDIGVLPLIKSLKSAYHGVTNPWYVDNYGSLGGFDNLERYFNSLKCHCLDQG